MLCNLGTRKQTFPRRFLCFQGNKNELGIVGFAEALETQIRRREKMQTLYMATDVNFNQSLLSPRSFSYEFFRTKKGER
jgi:hypothetical protein